LRTGAPHIALPDGASVEEKNWRSESTAVAPKKAAIARRPSLLFQARPISRASAKIRARDGDFDDEPRDNQTPHKLRCRAMIRANDRLTIGTMIVTGMTTAGRRRSVFASAVDTGDEDRDSAPVTPTQPTRSSGAHSRCAGIMAKSPGCSSTRLEGESSVAATYDAGRRRQ
jgi:hypothetical protein